MGGRPADRPAQGAVPAQHEIELVALVAPAAITLVLPADIVESFRIGTMVQPSTSKTPRLHRYRPTAHNTLSHLEHVGDPRQSLRSTGRDPGTHSDAMAPASRRL